MTRRAAPRTTTARPPTGVPPPALSVSITAEQLAAVARRVGVPPGVLQTLVAIAVTDRPVASLADALRHAADMLERKAAR